MVCHSDVYQGWPLGTRRGTGPRRRCLGTARGQLHLVGNLTGHHEPEPLAGLRGDVHRIAELDLLLFEIGDLRTQLGLGVLQLLHLGPLREVGADRSGDRQGQHADHRGQDRRAPCGRPQPLFGLQLGGFGDRLPDRLDGRQAPRASPRRPPARRRPAAARGAAPVAPAPHPSACRDPTRPACPAATLECAAWGLAASRRA